MTFTYYVPSSTPAIRQAMSDGWFGMITTPKQGNVVPNCVPWMADNGCYGRGYPGDTAWLNWLANKPGDRSLCAFATAPDVVGDAVATLQRSLPHLSAIRNLGYRAALVGQDGLEHLDVPWTKFDVLFIGGTTQWKLSEHARLITKQAVANGHAVHMGRVNSLLRMRYAQRIGCTSADGTYMTFGPDKLLPVAKGWIQTIREVVKGGESNA